MATKNLFQELLEEFKDDIDFKVEGVVLDITEEICKIMKGQELSRADLSRLLDISKPAVTRMLNGNTNFTLKRLIKIAMVLDKDLNVQFTMPKKSTNFNNIQDNTSIAQQTVQDAYQNWNDELKDREHEEKKPEFDKAA